MYSLSLQKYNYKEMYAYLPRIFFVFVKVFEFLRFFLQYHINNPFLRWRSQVARWVERYIQSFSWV